MFGNNIDKVERLIEKKKGDELVKLTADKDSTVRLKAIEGLGKVGGEAAFNTLITLLRSSEPSMRLAAANALGEMGDAKTRAHIEHQLKSEQDAQVGAALRAALGKIKEKI